MFKKFELTLTVRDENNKFQPISFDKIEDNNLVSLTLQFNIVIMSIHKKLVDKELENKIDDNIPF